MRSSGSSAYETERAGSSWQDSLPASTGSQTRSARSSSPAARWYRARSQVSHASQSLSALRVRPAHNS
ncbi:hypothetical protein SALBM217S_04375 [Streptomyces griseoloalbus]